MQTAVWSFCLRGSIMKPGVPGGQDGGSSHGGDLLQVGDHSAVTRH